MSKSLTPRFVWQGLLASAASAVVLCAFGLASPASAGVLTTTLCPSQADVGGINQTSSDVAGPLDGTCGTDSAVQIKIPASTDYGKLMFDSGMPGFPPYVSLSGLLGATANVVFAYKSGDQQPYFMLDFTDSSDSLGQGADSDQILMIEFQPDALVGHTLALDPSSTLFNLYDNTTGIYLQGGQSDTNTLDGWLSAFPSLGSEGLDGIWIGEGLTGSNMGLDSLTVNSLTVTSVPEPSTLALFSAALMGLGWLGFRRRRAQTAV